MIKTSRTDADIIAYSWSFFWIKRVTVGKRFNKLTFEGRNAVFAHEQGHVELHHTEKGLLCLLLTPWRFFKVCRKQELEADLYAASRGHALGLIDLLRYEQDATWSHPSHAERRKHLKKYEQTRLVPVKSHTRPVGVTAL
jgi:Zn-dependent protease with chaperone function